MSRKHLRSLAFGMSMAMLLTPAVLAADQLNNDADTLTTGTDNGAINLTLAAGASQTIHIGALVEDKSGGTNVSFPVPVSAAAVSGVILGTPDPASGNITGYESANEFKTDVVVTAPAAADLECGKNNSFTGKVRFTATDTADLARLQNDSVDQIVNITVAGPACPPTGPVDTDNDGVADADDNCPNVANPNQTDTDGDGIGNACDTDNDNDGVADSADNCPNLANANQADADADGIGNVCDPNAYAPQVVSTGAADATGNEGTTLSTTGAFSDGDGNSTLTITKVSGAGDVVDNGDGTWSWSLSTSDDGSGSVVVQAYDGDHTAVTDSFDWTATDVAPALSALSPSGNSAVACLTGGNSVGLSFSFTGASVDTFTGSIAWGDGTTSSFSSSPVSTSHTYTAAGNYSINVTIADEDGTGTDDNDTASVSLTYNVSGILQPVNDTQAKQDPSVFKFGSTIPVKIRITDCAGVSVAGVAAKVSVRLAGSTTPSDGVDETITNTNSPDSGGYMRYDSAGQVYIYNLATKSLSDATARYTITITGLFQTVTADFGTKSK